MRTNQHLSFLFCSLIFGSLFFEDPPPLPAAPPKDAPVGISGVSTGLTATLPDPKLPGKIQCELKAASASGQSDTGGLQGDLATVWAKLYQNGVPGAIFTAPHAHVGSIKKAVTITGTGGVLVKSLTEKGTTMTSDTVVWYTSSNQIVASGHVIYHSGKSGLVLTGPRMTFDTRLKSFQMGRGHGTMPL